MDASRARFGSAIEWGLAAAFLLVLVAVGSVVVRDTRNGGPETAVIAREPVPAAVVPAGVPSRAVSVPVLLLSGKKEVRVGDAVSVVARRLGRGAEVGSQSVERARYGERLTRFYDHEGTRFVLVFEPLEPDGEPHVAAIFLQ